MSCRRRDKTRLIGCHVGPGHVIGCPNETNDGDYERLIAQERYTFGPDELYAARLYSDSEDLITRNHGPGKHPYPCINPYRLKFVCTHCRRSFKQSIVEGQEYDVDSWGRICRVKPPEEKLRGVWERYKEVMGPSRKREDGRAMEVREMEFEYHCGGEEAFTKEKLEALREVSPYAHWRDMNRGAKCPGCGEKGRSVGGTFRPCARDDDKGWERIKEMLEDGEKFCYCMSTEELEEVIKEGRRLKERVEDRDTWTEEKNRRIRELKEAGKTGQRTKLEQERLEKIRNNKAAKVSEQRC